MTNPSGARAQSERLSAPDLLYPSSSDAESEERVSLSDVVAILVRRWQIVVIPPLAAIVLAVLITSFATREYVASARFMSASYSDRDRISAVAGTFGPLVLGGGGSASGPEFYTELARSRSLLRNVAQHEFTVVREEGTITAPLDRFIEIGDGGGAETRIRRLAASLRQRIGVSVQQRTGIVSVTTRAPYPDLAVQITLRLLDEINAFNAEKRQTQASATRRFIESRMTETQLNLAAAERELERFLNENRNFLDSPRLVFEHARLERRVDIMQRVYSRTAESLEDAKTEEVRNLPLITVLEGPEGSAHREPSGLARALLFAILAGLALGVTLAFAWEQYQGRRA